MKFLCPNCKAKYQISEEKIAGRTLKMDCRRCNHAIVIRGDKSSGRTSRSSSSALDKSRASYAGPAPARPSSGRGPSPAPAPERPTALDQWHVAINDVPVGPMRRDEIARKIATGAVTKESLAWREGLDDWRPIKNIPDLAPLLRRASAPPPVRQKPPLPPPPSRPMRGAKPVRAGRPPTGRQPSGRQPTAPQRRDAGRPAARGNVVPIGGRLGGSAAPAFEDLPDQFDDDEPTRVGSTIDFEQLEAEAGQDRERLTRERKEREERDREERAAQARRDADARAEDAARAEQAARKAARAEQAARKAARAEQARAKEQEEEDKAPAGLGAHIAHSDAFDPFASQAEPAPTPFAQPPAESAPAVAASEPAIEAVPVAHRRRAIPIGAWIAIAGAASFGVVLAVMVGTFYLSPPAPVAVAPPVPTPAPTPPPARALQVDPTLLEDPVEAPVENPVEATETETATAPSGGSSERPSRERNGTTTTGSGSGQQTGTGRRGSREAALDPEAQARLARFAGSSSDQAPNLDVSRPRTGLPGQEARSQTSTELTGEQITAVVSRGRSSVQRCYETFARQSGQAPAMRLDVDVTIGGSGTVTRATARGRSFGTVGECIERTVRRWRFPRTGARSRVSIPFVFTGRD